MSVSRLLRETLQLEKDVLVDRSHRRLAPRRSDGKSRAIVAKLHYYQDCVEVLSRARTQALLRFNEESIAIFPGGGRGEGGLPVLFTYQTYSVRCPY